MDQLRQIFLNAKVPESQINEIITNLRLEKLEDLGLYQDPQDFANAGVTDPFSQRMLARTAKDLERKRDAMVANQTNMEIQAQAEMAEKERRAATIVTLEDVYTDEASWMEALQQENTLQFTTNTYAAGIKAILATNIGLFQAAPKLMQMLKDYAKANARPVHNAFYRLQALMVERENGLIIGTANQLVIDDVPIYASEEDMAELIDDIQKELIPVIKLTVEKVGTWYASYGARAMDEFFLSQTSGGASAQYPNTAPLAEAARELRMAINRTFAGNGIQKALAICSQYSKFAKVLNIEDLPQAIGVVDKDAVLAQLGLDPSAAAVRSEKPIINFIIHAMETDKCSEADELRHCTGLFSLAEKIDWSGLTGDSRDAHLMDRYRTPRLMAGMPQPMLGGRYYNGGYPAQIQQMDGQPAALQIGTGIGAGRDC